MDVPIKKTLTLDHIMMHKSTGACDYCLSLFNKYPGFHKGLQLWFFKVQAKYPHIHISCAGRGYTDQIAAFKVGASRAVYGKSAHNYNCAIDVFFSLQGVGLYDEHLFEEVVAGNMQNWICWYGQPDAPFKELPHIEVRDWKVLVSEKLAVLVEPEPDI